MTVLVVADERDRSANDIVRGLDARGVDVARIDTGWFPQHMQIDAKFRAGRWSGEFHLPASRVVTLQDVRSIWYRSPTTFALPGGMSDAERAYVRREGKLGLGGVLTALPVLAVNDPHDAARAVYKPLQLTAAAACGLAVPTTQVTNTAAGVRRFAADAGPGGIVTKALGTTLLHEDDTYKLGYTRRLTGLDLADLRGIEATAHCQQHWVDKAWESRVVVVGEQVFAVRIDAGSPAAHVDWRSDYPALTYQVVTPPVSVLEGVRGVMARLRLVHAAFDFAVDDVGTWWFFEVNPGGVYGWLEFHTGVPITDALVDVLVEGTVA